MSKIEGKILVKAGIGSEQVWLGQTEREVREILGDPNRIIDNLEDSYFFVYSALGLDLDFGQKGSPLQVVFYYRAGVQGHQEAQISTDRGVELGDHRSKVLRVYGQPDKQSTPSELLGLKRYRDWCYYKEGIQFDFSLDDEVDVVSVSFPAADRSAAVA